MIGQATLAEYPLPAYTTVWASGTSPDAFTVYTYYGHRVTHCDGALRASGEHPLAAALRGTPAEFPPPDRRVNLQDAWRARVAAYRHQ
jgi:hypothetical protein